MVKKLSSSDVIKVCDLYKEGISTVSLGEMFAVSPTAINGLLSRRGIARRGMSEASRRYKINENYFAVLSPDVAYWAGFLAADGAINGNEVGLTLSNKDVSHLYKLKECLSSDHPVKTYSAGRLSYSYFRVNSLKMVLDLKKFGVTERKTFTLMPPTLPQELIKDYIRGYVDGDGGFSFSKAGNNNFGNITFSLTSTKSITEWIQCILQERCDLKKTKLYQRNKNSEIYTLVYSGRKQVRRIGSFLYDDSQCYLDRKFALVQLINLPTKSTRCSIY